MLARPHTLAGTVSALPTTAMVGECDCGARMTCAAVVTAPDATQLTLTYYSSLNNTVLDQFTLTKA